MPLLFDMFMTTLNLNTCSNLDRGFPVLRIRIGTKIEKLHRARKDVKLDTGKGPIHPRTMSSNLSTSVYDFSFAFHSDAGLFSANTPKCLLAGRAPRDTSLLGHLSPSASWPMPPNGVGTHEPAERARRLPQVFF